MAIKKEDIKGEADVSTEESKPEQRADTSTSRERKPRKDKPEGVKTYVYKGSENLLTLEVGGVRYDFRKGDPVYLPPGQSLDHPDVEEVK
jgi:hypothetical protein